MGKKNLGPQRRGPFKGGPRKANTQFTVTGVGSIKQRLGEKSKVPDARQKILQKTKFVDARSRIEYKKAQNQAVDVRNKINNSKAKKVDARQLLRARQQTQQPQNVRLQAPQISGTSGPRFMVTGLGKVALKTGPEVHTIPTIQSGQAGITKTIHTSHPTSPSSLTASAVAGNIVKTVGSLRISFERKAEMIDFLSCMYQF